MGPQPNDCPPMYLESSILARGGWGVGTEGVGVVTLDTTGKMYSDKQVQDTVGPPHRWQILQRPRHRNNPVSPLWLLFGCGKRGGGISGNADGGQETGLERYSVTP